MEYQKMESQRHILERKHSALKLIWKIILIIGTVITLIIGSTFPQSTTAWIVLVFLWGCFLSLIAYVFHKINVVRLELQSMNMPPEPVQVVYPAYYSEPVYPQVANYKDSNI
jgi:RsiW-degrading membrane proteinase PrsW (M82 family)